MLLLLWIPDSVLRPHIMMTTSTSCRTRNAVQVDRWNDGHITSLQLGFLQPLKEGGRERILKILRVCWKDEQLSQGVWKFVNFYSFCQTHKPIIPWLTWTIPGQIPWLTRRIPGQRLPDKHGQYLARDSLINMDLIRDSLTLRIPGKRFPE